MQVGRREGLVPLAASRAPGLGIARTSPEGTRHDIRRYQLSRGAGCRGGGLVAGAIWDMALAKPWMAAVGTTKEKIEAAKSQPGASLPFVFAFVASVIMAWVLAGVHRASRAR